MLNDKPQKSEEVVSKKAGGRGSGTNAFIIDENYMANVVHDGYEESKTSKGRTYSSSHASTTETTRVLDYTNTYSARAAYQKSKQYDGFEILDDDLQKEQDVNLLT